jgi:hypothetical protein
MSNARDTHTVDRQRPEVTSVGACTVVLWSVGRGDHPYTRSVVWWVRARGGRAD